MPRIVVSTHIDADPSAVWGHLRDIRSHTEWMADAESIVFTSPTTEGVGTTFDCRTAVGPIRTLDRMEVTEWEDNRTMGVRHVGVVTGEGRFSLQPADGGTRLTWDETLEFPWWLGGRPAGIVPAQALRLVWISNLRRLRRRVEGSVSGRGPDAPAG